MLQAVGPDFNDGARPWGYVSARVSRLTALQSLDLPARTSKFVLVSGSLRIEGEKAPPEALFALAEPVDIVLPPAARWSLQALSEAVVVIYTER